MLPIHEVAPNVSGVAAFTPTLLPATHTNSYALGARDVVLVEPATPYDDEQREWLEWARGLGSQGRRPVALFATHHHPDHVGGLPVLARELGLPVWAHEETAARIQDTHVSRCLQDGEPIVLAGPEPSAWRALHTPGHAPGHLCLHEEVDGILVVGDMVASVGTILIAPGDGDMGVYLGQLERLARLGARVALPAHGAPIVEPSLLLRHYVAHRLAREGKVLEAVRSCGEAGGALDALVLVAYSDTPPAIHPIAKLSLESHLEKLVGEGAVRLRDGRYTAVPISPVSGPGRSG